MSIVARILYVPRGYSMVNRAAMTAAIRQRILEAALDELVAADSGSITLQAVAARADLALRTLYNHFPNRGALLSAAFEHHAAQSRAAVEAVSLPEGDPTEQLRHAIGAYYSRYAAMGPRLMALLSVRGFPALDEQIVAIRAWRRGVLRKIIRRARRAGTLTMPESIALALAYTMTSHATWQTLADELDGTSPDPARAAGDMLCAALFRPAAESADRRPAPGLRQPRRKRSAPQQRVG
ncbi:MAG: TetR/AcrR family transcriptional regulator [Solirubrobacterales bacterium]|nr:TetR/AcrR family transcriptional regulator [Solirubrobacterales bacterium]